MASITRFDFLTEMVSLQSAMDRLFEGVKPRQIRIVANGSGSAVDETSAS